MSEQKVGRLGGVGDGYPLEKDPATKSDEFLEKCQGGGGSFSIQKFILQIWEL